MISGSIILIGLSELINLIFFLIYDDFKIKQNVKITFR